MGILPANLRPDIDALRADLAAETLRNIVKDGWSLLDMSAGVADALVDQTGLSALGGATYDATGKYLHNPAGYARITGATPSAPLGGTAANINDNNPATSVGVYIGTNTGAPVSGRILAQLDFGANVTVTKAEAVGAFNSGAAGTVAGHGFYTSTDGFNWTLFGALFGVANVSGTYSQTGNAVARYLAYAVPGISWSCTPTIGDLNGYINAAPASVATRSISFVPATPATLVRLVALWEPVDAAILGTDCLMSVSANGGTGYTALALSDLGKFDATTRIIGGVAAVGAGSAIRWGWNTANAKAQRLRGVWAQWR